MRTKISSHEIFMAESIGKQFKYWFTSFDLRYLFKRETKKQDGSSVYDDVSECMAMEIARLIGIEAAQYYLCENEGQKCVITPDFLGNNTMGPKKEEFFDGVYLISQIDPDFKNKSLLNPKTHQYYTVDLLIQSVEKYGLTKQILEMIVYDALIGNRDRNPSNYGIIINHQDESVRLAPLYDNCTSLGISMVDHRLAECYDKKGMIVNDKQLDIVIHKHIVGKVTLDRHLQYKEKRQWDKEESKRILTMIESKKRELIPLLETGAITAEDYHEQLNKIGDSYRKYDISTLEYQPLISYLSLYYPEEISEIMQAIEDNINERNIDKAFAPYLSELPPDRMAFARKMVLDRAAWMTAYYGRSKVESRGKVV